MRAFARGKPFMHIPGDHFMPNEEMLNEMATEDVDIPVFSEAYLYPRLGKEDARFVLGVAEEYETLIKRLGTDEIKRLLRRD